MGNIAIALIGFVVVAYVAYRLLTSNSASGGGGGGSTSDPLKALFGNVLTGVHAVTSPSGSISEVSSSGTYLGSYTQKTNVLGPTTYIAPTYVQNLNSPGSALPAPSPGIGLGPKAIIL